MNGTIHCGIAGIVLLGLVTFGCGSGDETDGGPRAAASAAEAAERVVRAAVEGDRAVVEAYFMPCELLVEMMRARAAEKGESLTDSRLEEMKTQYEKGRRECVDACVARFGRLDPESLTYRDIGSSRFSANEQEEIRKFSPIESYCDVRVFEGEKQVGSLRILEFRGGWYYSDAS